MLLGSRSLGQATRDPVTTMSAEQVARIPQCEECRSVWLGGDDERWRTYWIEDGPEEWLVFYCRECAEREFCDVGAKRDNASRPLLADSC